MPRSTVIRWSAKELASSSTLKIVLTHNREMRLRFAIAGWLIKLAELVSGLAFEVSDIDISFLRKAQDEPLYQSPTN
jgi:hypothetical protein